MFPNLLKRPSKTLSYAYVPEHHCAPGRAGSITSVQNSAQIPAGFCMETSGLIFQPGIVFQS